MAIAPLIVESASAYMVIGITLLLTIYSVGYSWWAFKNPIQKSED